MNYADENGLVATRAGFSVFTSIMAFTNSGISLRPTFRQVSPWLLLVVDVLCLAGNTFFPILLRWFIIFASKVSAVESNRKVYFRYLLMAGRNHYTHLFTSQQTWTLVTLQLCFLLFQTVVGRILGTKVNLNQAFFMSVNTRHAGFSSVDLGRQNSGILVLWAMMMFLAPTPFVVVLKKSAKEQDQRLEQSMSLGQEEVLNFRPSSLHFEVPKSSDDAETTEVDHLALNALNRGESESFDDDSLPGQTSGVLTVMDLDDEISPANSLEGNDVGEDEEVELENPDAAHSNRRMASRILSMGLVVRSTSSLFLLCVFTSLSYL